LLLRLEKFIKSLIEKNDVCEPQQQMALGLHWLNQPHRMMLIEFESAMKVSADKIYRLAGQEESFILQWDDCSFLGFVKQPAVNSQSKIMSWEHEYVNRFFSNLKTVSHNVNIYYCYSSGCQQMSDTFSRLTRVKEYNIFYQGYGHLCETAGVTIPDCPLDVEIIDWQVFRQLAIIRNWGEIKDRCHRAFRHFNQNALPAEYVKRCTIEMIGIITDVLQSNGSLIEMSWGSNKLEYVSKVQEIKTIGKLEEFLYKGIDALEENRAIFIGGINKVIEKAIAYIERNYYKEITLDDLSTHAGLSKSYLSSSFKKVTGENFIDYLIHLRIERAKQLFQQTELKTFEVAEKVGIQDPKYFTKLFKRIEGISPKTFKDMGRKKVNPL
jgi:two-component system response regulator YesN